MKTFTLPLLCAFLLPATAFTQLPQAPATGAPPSPGEPKIDIVSQPVDPTVIRGREVVPHSANYLKATIHFDQPPPHGFAVESFMVCAGPDGKGFYIFQRGWGIFSKPETPGDMDYSYPVGPFWPDDRRDATLLLRPDESGSPLVPTHSLFDTNLTESGTASKSTAMTAIPKGSKYLGWILRVIVDKQVVSVLGGPQELLEAAKNRHAVIDSISNIMLARDSGAAPASIAGAGDTGLHIEFIHYPPADLTYIPGNPSTASTPPIQAVFHFDNPPGGSCAAEYFFLCASPDDGSVYIYGQKKPTTVAKDDKNFASSIEPSIFRIDTPVPLPVLAPPSHTQNTGLPGDSLIEANSGTTARREQSPPNATGNANTPGSYVALPKNCKYAGWILRVYVNAKLVYTTASAQPLVDLAVSRKPVLDALSKVSSFIDAAPTLLSPAAPAAPGTPPAIQITHAPSDPTAGPNASQPIGGNSLQADIHFAQPPANGFAVEYFFLCSSQDRRGIYIYDGHGDTVEAGGGDLKSNVTMKPFDPDAGNNVRVLLPPEEAFAMSAAGGAASSTAFPLLTKQPRHAVYFGWIMRVIVDNQVAGVTASSQSLSTLANSHKTLLDAFSDLVTPSASLPSAPIPFTAAPGVHVEMVNYPSDPTFVSDKGNLYTPAKRPAPLQAKIHFDQAPQSCRAEYSYLCAGPDNKSLYAFQHNYSNPFKQAETDFIISSPSPIFNPNSTEQVQVLIPPIGGIMMNSSPGSLGNSGKPSSPGKPGASSTAPLGTPGSMNPMPQNCKYAGWILRLYAGDNVVYTTASTPALANFAINQKNLIDTLGGGSPGAQLPQPPVSR